MVDVRSCIGLTASAINVSSNIPYIASILRGQTKPQRATYVIWFIVVLISVFSYHEVGARATLWVLYAGLFNIGLTFLLSLKYGIGGWQPLDKVCLLGAAISLTVWWRTHSALLGLVIIVFVGVLGTLLTCVKLWRHPGTEDALAWAIGLFGVGLNLFAIEHWTFSYALYPVCSFCETCFITVFSFRKPSAS